MENVVFEPQKCSGVGDPPIGSGLGASSRAGSPRVGGRSRRRALGTAFAVGLGVAALGGAPASAVAADDCPNAAVRAQQQSQHLPNCMAYEQMTPHEKGGAYPKLAAIADDGDGVIFQMNSMLGEQQSFHLPRYRTRRAGDAWEIEGLLPSMDGPVRRVRLTADVLEVVASSQDLSRTLIYTGYPFSPNDRGPGAGRDNPFATQDLYLREPDGTMRWLAQDPSVPSTVPGNVVFVGASPDLERVVLVTPRPFDPRASTQQVYMATADGVHLVSELPSGMPAAASTHGGGSNAGFSADARRVGFQVASGADQGVYVRFNADDPDAAFTRRVAEGPAGEACTGASLVRLSADGRKVIFSCSNALLPGAPTDANYVRDLDGGPTAVRLLGTGTVWRASDDFSRLYVTGLHGDGNEVWVVRDGVETRVATRVAGTGRLFVNNGNASDGAAVSRDGEYFAFESTGTFDLPGIDQGTTDASQVFLVSARTGEVQCVSCRQDGTPTDGGGTIQNLAPGLDLPYGMADVPVVSSVLDDGTVIFTSMASLVPEDANGVADAYAWIDGRPVLLSGGRGEPSLAAGASADGSRLFVATPDALVTDDRDGGQYDLYVARVNGGSLVETPPAPCTVNCQGPGQERQGLPMVGTGNALSNGNVADEVASPSVRRASASVTVPRSVRGTRTTVRVKVSGAGSIRTSGPGIRQATVKAKKAGTYRVTVRLSAHGSQLQRSRGRLATKLTARFTPKSGASVLARKSVTFTRATTKGGR